MARVPLLCCGVVWCGGLCGAVTLSPLFPDELLLGLEIRDRVVALDRKRISQLRAQHSNTARTADSTHPPPYSNISVVHTNVMKYAPNYFHRGQLRAMFVLFPDPHFKRANHRRRVLASAFLPLYAYCLRLGGKLYTVTDVKELAEWMAERLRECPLFERVDDEELSGDPCVDAMLNGTEEGKKVTRLSGNKYPAVWRRIAPKHDVEAEEEQKESGRPAVS